MTGFARLLTRRRDLHHLEADIDASLLRAHSTSPSASLRVMSAVIIQWRRIRGGMDTKSAPADRSGPTRRPCRTVSPVEIPVKLTISPIAPLRGRLRVTGGKTLSEYIFSGLPQVADIARTAFHSSASPLVLQITAFWVRAIPH